MTSLCLNPDCPQPENPDKQRFCTRCGQPLQLAQRYRPLKRLGQGGFGRTFLAVDESQDPPQRCVIKQNWERDRNCSSTELAQRFQDEANLLRVLGSHPQIPQLLDYFDLETGQFLVQEYMPGPNLEQVLGRRGPLEEARIRQLLSEILPVLQFVHEHQVIHRDVKPANLIAPTRPGPLALVDFGASKYISQAAQLDNTGTVIGSAAYVAPEQALGKATFASDIYSLGVTCVHLLTGQHPFDLYSVSEDRWIWRTFVQSPVSLQLARLLDQMMARGLRERYASASAVLADLRWSGPLAVAPETAPSSLSAKQGRRSGLVLTKTDPQWHLVRTIDQPGGVAASLAVSPNGCAIATGSTDQAIRLWDVASGELIYSFAKRIGFWGVGHQDGVTALAFSPDGYTLYSASQDGALKAWNLADYRLDWQVATPGWGTAAMVLTTDGETLITAGGEGKIQLWQVPSRTLRAALIHHQDWVSSLAASTDGQYLTSGSWDKTLRLWHLPTGRLLKTLTAPAAKITAVAFDHGKDWTGPIGPTAGEGLGPAAGEGLGPAAGDYRLYSGDNLGNVQIWQPQQSDRSRLLTKHGDAVTTLATSTDGAWLATGSEDGTLQVWALPSETRTAILKHDWGVQAAVFTPDSQTLISSSADETIRIWRRAQTR